MSMTLTPAYGRDYTSQKAVKADFEDGKDFVIADMMHPDCGRYCNREDLQREGVKAVNIRYKRNTQVCVVKV